LNLILSYLISQENLGSEAMHVLIIGSGGREHALAVALAASPKVSQLSVAPGNPGMEMLAQRLEIDVLDIEGLLIHAQREKIDLTIVGPEAPLAAGIVDRFTEAGLLIFGPVQAAAQLEASKLFAKQMMQQANVPTGHFVFAQTESQALEGLSQFNPPYVIKEDGLAAGKGVTVTSSQEEAEIAIANAFAKNSPVLLEACLYGQELSVLAVCDGVRALPLVAAQDFKRVGDGNTGPNTGGMGAYAPVPFADAALMEKVQTLVLNPILNLMAKRGTPYKGILYAGLMVNNAGDPAVIEFNCRFGDPETQVVLPLLTHSGVDLFDLLFASAQGNLAPFEGALPEVKGAAVTVVVASGGYPAELLTNQVITLPEALPEGVTLYHAGTKRLPKGDLVNSGGRVFTVTGVGATLDEARKKAYEVVPQVKFEGAFYRSDIAAGLSLLKV
jgi:phosphoribosylamine---glycine ligase